jgi:putative DNA primase/helicase
MTPLDLVLAKLDGRVRRSGRSYQARCPAHEDRSPSLSIREGHDGRVLLHCHAGCDTREVLAEIGLGFRDLFPSTARSRGRSGYDRSLW